MRRSRVRRMLVQWLAAGFAVLMGASILVSPALGATEERVEEVARLPIFWPKDVAPGGFIQNGNMVINPAARRGYQFFQRPATVQVQIVDLDSFAHVGGRELPFLPALGSPSGGGSGEYVHTLSPDGGSIYMGYLENGSWTGIAELDPATMAVRRTLTRVNAFTPEIDPNDDACVAASCLPTPPGARPEIRGLSYVEGITSPTGRDKLLLMLEDSPGPAASFSTVVWVAQWDVETGRQDWIYRVQACSSQALPRHTFSRYQLDLFQSGYGPQIYLGCFASGGTGQVVRLDQDASSQPLTETGFPGPLGLIDVFADPTADRIHLKVSNEEGESYWVFDGRTSSYVGVIGTTLGSVSAAAGMDPTTGRLYVLGPPSASGTQSSTGGLFIADARRSPAPQAIVFPEFAGTSLFRIRIDPETPERRRRLFIKRDKDDFFRVVEDRVSVSTDPPLADQDRFTQNVEEKEGVTSANYTGTAHAYGLRSLFIGGIEGASPRRGTTLILGSPCQRPDREIVIGRVKRAALSNSLASATSIATDAEQTTRTDLQEPVSRCYSRGVITGFDALAETTLSPALTAVDGAAGRPWPFKESECAGTSRAEHTADDPLSGFASKSTCVQKDEQVLAQAAGDGLTDPGGVKLKVGQAFSSTRLERKIGKGLVARSEAWVRNIEVPGAFTIDTARTVAEAFAGGRPGTAGTTFTREVCGVRIAGAALGQAQDVFFEGCYDPLEQAGQPQPAITNQVTDRPLVFLLNRALGSRGRVRVPEPDDELKKGTPGGYLASLQKNRGEEIQARAISNDASTEVPALEVIAFNDDEFAGRGRQVYQFAGVDASTTYGIFLPPTIDFGGADGLDGSAGDLSLPDLLVELTGGFPEVGPTNAIPASDVLEGPANQVAQLVNRIVRTIAFFARSPREAALAASVWLLLGFPIYLAGRRRALVGRPLG